MILLTILTESPLSPCSLKAEEELLFTIDAAGEAPVVAYQPYEFNVRSRPLRSCVFVSDLLSGADDRQRQVQRRRGLGKCSRGERLGLCFPSAFHGFPPTRDIIILDKPLAMSTFAPLQGKHELVRAIVRKSAIDHLSLCFLFSRCQRPMKRNLMRPRDWPV